MDVQNESLEVNEQEIDAAWEGEATPTGTEETGVEDSLPAAQNDSGALAQNDMAEEQPMGEDRQADQPEVFTLKHMDETKQVGKDEVVVLAQKGMDYDRIRTERDQLRTYRQEADPALGLVKAYAQRNGMEVGAYLDFCRKQELMAQGVNETTADAQISVEKQRTAMEAQHEEVENQRQRQAQLVQDVQRKSEARKQDMRDFIAQYPGVDAERIPKDVWEKVASGESLVSAFTMHRNRELENQLAAQQQNKQNQQRTTGSLSTTENRGGKSISDLWDECDI